MKVLLPLVIFISTVNFSFAQKKIKLLNGQIIVDEKNSESYDVQGIVIRNLNANQSTVSSFSGKFKIEAAVGDSLHIKSSYFYDRTIVVSTRIFEKGNLIVHLNEDVIELDAAAIRGWNYTGYLEDDVKKIVSQYDTITELYKSLGINPKVRDLEPQENIDPLKFMEVFPLTADLGRISQAISGDLRRKRNLRTHSKLTERLNKIQSFYKSEYFKEDLGIPESQVYQYIIYCFYNDSLANAVDKKNFLIINESLESRKDEFLESLQEDNLIESKKEEKVEE